MKTSDFDYELPTEYIAQTPLDIRDQSRLMILDRETHAISHSTFNQIAEYLKPGDLLVLNETRVLPARLYGSKLPGGGRIELLLLSKRDERTWEVMVGGKGLKVGRQLRVDGGPAAEVIAELGGPKRLLAFTEPIEPHLPEAGHVPLPPYIKAWLADPERYQTVYAHESGSAAAPTAGLHFTPRLLAQLQSTGINLTYVTLHVGLDTFAPVMEENPAEHEIHTEYCRVTADTARLINRTRQERGRIIAVGTTSVRTLESAAKSAGKGDAVSAFEGPTDLFILPGFDFRVVDGMITNFHLPRSSLIMLVSAFYEQDRILSAYETAKQLRYRFYSFGDAMLIL